MTLLANRQVRLTFDGGIVSDELRTAFRVRKTLTPEINTAEIHVYNLNKTNRGFLKRRRELGHEIELSAGYEQAFGKIYQGRTNYITHVHANRIDWITTLICGDGIEAKEVFINEAFGPGTQVFDVVLTIAQATGLDFTALLPLRGLFSQSQTVTFQSGYTTTGNALDALNTLLIGVGGVRWTIIDGTIYVIPKNGVIYPGAVTVLNSNTGLIGSPTRTETGFIARALLDPRIQVGSLVNVVSREFALTGRVDVAEYTGDTWANDWYVDIECTDISDPLLDDLDYLLV